MHELLIKGNCQKMADLGAAVLQTTAIGLEPMMCHRLSIMN